MVSAGAEAGLAAKFAVMRRVLDERQLRAVFPDGQAATITIAELLGHADRPGGRAGGAPEVDVHTAFAFVHRDVGGFDAAERNFHAAGAA